MKKIIAAVASVTAIAALAVPALASANVSSAQKTTPLTLTTTYNGVQYVHDYTLTVNPLTGSFTGTDAPGSPVGVDETVSGTLVGPFININGAYHDGSGYTWHYTGLLNGMGVGGDSLSLKWSVVFKVGTSDFVDHSSHTGHWCFWKFSH